MTPKLFAELGLSPEILKAIDKLGFEKPAPIQASAIPILMQGSDIVGQSQTGSGKTAAFAIPVIEKYFGRIPSRPAPDEPRRKNAALFLKRPRSGTSRSALSRMLANVAARTSPGQAGSGTVMPSRPASQRIWPARPVARLS